MIHYLIIQETIVVGFIVTYIETIMAFFTLFCIGSLYLNRYKKSHSSLEKSYLKPTGRFDREKSRLSHTYIMAPYWALLMALHVLL